MECLKFNWDENFIPSEESLSEDISLFQHMKYLFYVTSMQTFQVGKAISKIVKAHNIVVIEIESTSSGNFQSMQWETLYSTFYTDVAYHWAEFNNFNIKILPSFVETDTHSTPDKASLRNYFSSWSNTDFHIVCFKQ